jgi:hypothetical protein
MSLETDLKAQIKQNDNYLYIVEADDLIAAWSCSRNNKFKRSCDFERVPTKYRYSAPPSRTAPLIPCHVSLKTAEIAGSEIKCTGITACHHSHVPGVSPVVSIDNLKTVDFTRRNVAPYISPIIDTATLAMITKDLGITGTAVPKVIKGRQYIVFGGYAGQRTMFRGTVYSRNNAKIIQMAIGSLGIKHMVKSGARLTIYLTVPLTILQCILEDQTTLSTLLGRVTSDLIQVGISSLAGGLAGLTIGAVTTYAAAPIVVAIVFCLITGWGVDAIDQHFGLTDNLIRSIENTTEAIAQQAKNIDKELGRKLHEAERQIIYRGSGFDINNPLRTFQR